MKSRFQIIITPGGWYAIWAGIGWGLIFYIWLDAIGYVIKWLING